MNLYIVRHGESDGNYKRIYCGHTDVPLTEKGKKQAENMAMLLKDRYITKIYSSPLQRAYSTALEISRVKNMPVETNEFLKERCFGLFEGLNWDDIEAKYPEEAKKCIEQNIFYEYKDGETLEHVIERASKFLEQVEDNSVVVSHGFFIRTVLYRLGFLSLDNLYDYHMDNCDVLYIDDDKVVYIE